MRARLGSASAQAGFSLIEVLVAVAIVAVALAAGSRAAGALLNNAQRLTDVSAAQWCADNRLTNMRLARQFPDLGEASADCEMLGRSYRLRQRVQPTPNPNFRRIDLAVSDTQEQPLITLSTVLPRY